MRLSQRVLRQPESATMAVARRALELKAEGVRLFDLGAGEPMLDSPAAAVEGAMRALREGYTRYTSVDGPADLRRALALRFAREGGPWSGDGDVIVTVGAKAALFEVLMALVDPGTEVVVPTPAWSTLAAQVRFAGGVDVPVRAAPDAFRLEAGPLLDACTDRTRAILLNSPCNPTGAVIAPDQLERLVHGCAERGVVLISDETYRDFVYAPGGVGASSVVAWARDAPDTVVLVSSFSKGSAMTGWRVGYALGPGELVAATRTVQSHTTSNPTSFAMRGALACLGGDDDFIARHHEHCRRNRTLVEAALRDHPAVRFHVPDGAFYAFPRIDSGPESTADLAARLLEEEGVVVVAGEAFGAPGHLRISFAGDSGDLEEGLRRLTAAL